MPVRRTVVAFAVVFVCALAVFPLPRFVWNTVQGAVRPQQPPAADSTAASPAPQAAPRSIPQRLTGTFDIGFILGIGIALSRNCRSLCCSVGVCIHGLPAAFGFSVMRTSLGPWLCT